MMEPGGLYGEKRLIKVSKLDLTDILQESQEIIIEGGDC